MASSADMNKQLLLIIKHILHGSTDQIKDLEKVDYAALLEGALEHGVANTIADFVCAQKKAPDSVKQQFRKQWAMIVKQHTLCDLALRELYGELDKHKIRGLFLKGVLLKAFYPQVYHRSMSDIDVFMEEQNMEAVQAIMGQGGYENGKFGQDNHYEYMRQEMVKVEYHPELVALESDYGRRIFTGIHPEAVSIADHMDIWHHTIPLDGHEYARQLEPEYHYLYVIMHMMNHFLTAGTGIRSLMDVWVMNRHYAGSWDRGRIEALLADFGLLNFEKYALALTHKWFDLEDLPYLPKEIQGAVLTNYEDYILESGTYGNKERSLVKQMKNQASGMSKLKYMAGRFFLPYGQMKEEYPMVEKCPILLPLLWPYRVFDMFRKRGKSTRQILKLVLNADQKRVDRQQALMDAMME